MKIDTGLGAELATTADRDRGCRGGRPRLRLGRRDGERPVPVARARRRALGADVARHRGRDRVRPQPDEPGVHDEPAAGVLARPARARAGFAGAARTSSGGSARRGRIRRPACASSCSRCARSGRRGTTGATLDFDGDFYTHTLMTPVFAPPPHAFGAPRVFLAAVGPRMTEVAGEVADGVITHGVSSPRYLREVTLPALERGLDTVGPHAGRRRGDVPGLHRGGRRPRKMAKARDGHAPPPRRTTRRPPRTAPSSSCTAGVTCRPSSTPARSRAAGTRWRSSSTTRCSTRCTIIATPDTARGGGAARATAGSSTGSRVVVAQGLVARPSSDELRAL